MLDEDFVIEGELSTDRRSHLSTELHKLQIGQARVVHVPVLQEFGGLLFILSEIEEQVMELLLSGSMTILSCQQQYTKSYRFIGVSLS